MTATARCLLCRKVLAAATGPCPHCGGPVEVSVAISGVQATAQVGRVGTVLDSCGACGAHKITVAAPTGSSSTAVMDEGLVSFEASPPVDIGRPGEARVMACILAAMENTGISPQVMQAVDGAGEDGVLKMPDGTRLVVQMVSAQIGTDRDFWRDVAKGGGIHQGTVDDAASWINSAIAKKAATYTAHSKLDMLLAVDVAHFGVLCRPDFIAHYLREHGDPSDRFGFAAVWLVGPSEGYVARIGKSAW